MKVQWLKTSTPQERDRVMQWHLAQARGPVRNARLMRRMTATLLRARQGAKGRTTMSTDPVLDVLEAAVTVLEAAGVEDAITGSVASSIHGEPYSSQDVDLVVRMTPEQARQIAEQLPRRFYRSEDALVRAAQTCGMANLIDTDTGLKVDLSVLTPSGFHDRVFERRVMDSLGGTDREFAVVSAEDIILMKLAWRKDTRSAKQWENALGVARCQGTRMDWKYLFEQAVTLGIVEDLERLRDEAGI
jgi:hypothetical protein